MNINTRKFIEEYVKIRDKQSKIVNFKLNDPQLKLYEIIKKQHKAKKPIRVIILKARQMGFSTLTEAVIFKKTVTKPNVNSGIITHSADATNNLFNMSKRMYDNLPKVLQPEIKNSNAKELIFDKEGGKGLGSKIRCMTAGQDGVGRSDTINNLHISELAFWTGDKKETLAGLFQAVPNTPDSMIIIESTANGFEFFKELWERAVKGESDYIPLFVGWNELQEYQMPYNDFILTKDELHLKEVYGLSNEQLTWRRWCIDNNCNGDVEQFKQEYPINPHEAFISTGNCIFDKEQIIKKMEEKTKPIRTGYFDYKYDGLTISEIKWVTDPKGFIKIYEVPNIYKYAIGGDTSGEGSDNFTGQVINAKTGKQVAVLKHQFDEDVYARQMYCLGAYYKWALIGIETNFSTYPVKELERLKYPNLYVREKEDSITHQIIKSFGFKTTSLTRPLIISELVQIVRDHIELFSDEDTFGEMLTFIKNEKGKPEAQQGYHDDLIIALAIAHYIKTQVIFDKEPIIVPFKPFFTSESNSGSDWGEKVEVI